MAALEELMIKQEQDGVIVRLLARADLAVVMIGAPACLRPSYFQARRAQAIDRLFLCPMEETDYLFGSAEGKVRETVLRALSHPAVHRIVLYQSCADYITHADYASLLEPLCASHGVSLFVYQRGSVSLARVDKEAVFARATAPGDDGAVVHEKWDKAGTPFSMPPAVSDYSAVCSALRGSDAMVCLMTSGGCGAALSTVDEVEKADNLYFSRISDVELSRGCAAPLAEKIEACARELGRKSVVLVGTAISSFFRYDMAEVRDRLEQNGLAVTCAETNGFGVPLRALSSLYLALDSRFAVNLPVRRGAGRGINLIGCAEAIQGPASLWEPVLDALTEKGLVPYIYGQGGAEQLVEARRARWNWVVSPAGLALAVRMQERDGIPYAVGMTFGAAALEGFCRELTKSRAMCTDCCASDLIVWENKGKRSDSSDSRTTLIIAEPYLGRGIEAACGARGVRRAVYLPDKAWQSFCIEAELLKDTVQINGRAALDEAVRKFDRVIADPLFEPYVHAASPRATFIPFPDYAVSGRTYAGGAFSPFGAQADAWLSNCFSQ